MKAIYGLGNPGPEYDDTRHNVGWWLVDRLCADWGLGPLERSGPALVADGRIGGRAVRVLKPHTYMNRSGAALAPLAQEGVDLTRDLLVAVDDSALEVGRLRFRARGSAGGHNGLRSIERVLGTREYARLRIGIGRPPPGVDMVDWVLSAFEPEDEERILERLGTAVEGVRVWVEEGIDAAMNRFNG
ncbi:MAG: aminoacyl-tRNA hydrolase [Gemmatimonadota bacterium]